MFSNSPDSHMLDPVSELDADFLIEHTYSRASVLQELILCLL